jgi:ABC-type transport system substrate-binding protein
MFSSKSDGWQNFQQTNDTLVQQWMEEGLVESNPTLRNNIYFNIQRRLIEEVYPVAWLYSNVWYDIYRSNLRGWGYWGAGAFKNLYFV